MSLQEIVTLKAGVTRTHRFRFAEDEELAAQGLSLAGTPVVTATPSAGLTVGAPAIVGDEVEVDLTGATAGTQYALLCVCGLSAGAGQVFREGTLYVT